MKLFAKYLAISTLTVAVYTPVFALQNLQKNADYTIVAYDNCKVVLEQAMTQQQIDSYLKLKEFESDIHSVEMNLEGVEEELNAYAEEVTALTEMAIQETETSLYIDKTYMKQQEEAAHRLDAFMQQHEDKFRALEHFGDKISDAAEQFEASIEMSLDGIDYDRVQVFTPDSSKHRDACDNSGVITIM